MLGLICAGKILHHDLEASGSICIEWFERECEILSQLRHPNIVQFLGVTYEKDSPLPILVMEYLPFTLYQCIMKYHPFPERVTFSILRDVALGLCYLHDCKSTIHRDLTAKNILLTPNMTAKIADLGVARNPNLGPSRMTPAPGCLDYMPPEAFQGHYGKEIDIFSLGVLILHTFTGDWPTPDPDRGPPNQAKRRERHLHKLGPEWSLRDLTMRCLSDEPKYRPCAYNVLEEIEKLTPEYRAVPDFDNRVTMMKLVTKQDRDLKDLREQIESLKMRNSAPLPFVCVCSHTSSTHTHNQPIVNVVSCKCLRLMCISNNNSTV